MHPNNPGLLNNLGVVYVKMNRLSRAEETFHSALDADPSYVKAHLNLALVLSADNRQEEAVRRLREIINSYPATPEASSASKLLSDLENAAINTK
jgi:predicted Zn-dependent protease